MTQGYHTHLCADVSTGIVTRDTVSSESEMRFSKKEVRKRNEDIIYLMTIS